MTADVRTDFSVWVSFSTSRIVPLHIIFRWLVNWDIAGFNILACFNVFRLVRLCLRLGIQARQATQKILGPRIRRGRGVRFAMLDACVSKILHISSDL